MKPVVSLPEPFPVDLPSSHIVNWLPAPSVWDLKWTHRAKEHPFMSLCASFVFNADVSLTFGTNESLYLVCVSYLNLKQMGHLYLVHMDHLYIWSMVMHIQCKWGIHIWTT